MEQIGVVGAGASGMMAAIAAAEKGGRVTVLERQDRVGKKILATGNGRCNLSNRDLEPKRDYPGSDPKRLSAWFGRFGVQDTVDFFESRGLLIVDKNGYLYPRNLQASAVLELLRAQLERLAVRQVCSCKVLHIRREGRFVVQTDNGEYLFDRLILSCGSRAGQPEGRSCDGFDLAAGLGLPVVEPLPALTALVCEGRFWKELAGVRCQARIGLRICCKGRKQEYEETGELQLTEYGISGIPVFQLSRFASRALAQKAQVTACIDFFPEYDEAGFCALMDRQIRACRDTSLEWLAYGMLPKKVAQVLLKSCGLRPQSLVQETQEGQIRAFFERARAFGVSVIRPNPLSQSQVCTGGVPLTQIGDDFGVRKIPGLYLCGEMLDVDGRCGGYNLQWAWSSGYLAGLSVAGKADQA